VNYLLFHCERAKQPRKVSRLQMALFIVGLVLALGESIRAQTTETLPDYVPLLPQVTAKAPVVDRNKGYFVSELKPGVFMVTEGAYESVFVITGKGVVLFDAPPSFAQHLGEAVKEKTNEPIVELVYSHTHVDHIGGAGWLLKQNPKIEIVAEEGTAEFLREMQDPHRPVPTRTFKEHETLRLGSLHAEMKVGHWHSPEGDLLISIPDKRVVIAIDAFSAGASPFMDLDLTMNMHEYMKLFDQLAKMDFDVIVPGHHSTPATREDLQIAQSYVTDVYKTALGILGEDHQALKARAIEKYGRENGWAVASVLINSEVNQCAEQIKSRWISKLEGVDIWAASHCKKALVYAEWDVGPR
jgi:glyoxylase-like metal-dependent hydrolase (beta-lactamase superfamily II)